MLIAVTGARGFVGKALVEKGCLPLLSNVTNPVEIDNEIRAKKPDAILHLASKSDVDFCEKIENRDCVIETNVRGAYNVFSSAFIANVPCVLFSSSQIWKGGFWEREHRENDKLTPPVNFYGMSKLGAENVAKMFDGHIVRLSYVFDYSRLAPKIERLRAGELVYEPTFIRRSFIYLSDFVELVIQYANCIKEMPEVLHLAGSETDSWCEFMHEVAHQYGLDSSLVKGRRKEVGEYAPRPHNGGLNTNLARSLGLRVPSYEDGIARMKYES